LDRHQAEPRRKEKQKVKQTKTYKGEGQPTFIHDIKIRHQKSDTARTLTTWMEASLEKSFGHPAGRYTFKYAEIDQNGNLCLQFFGPSRRAKKRYRTVWAGAETRNSDGIYKVLDVTAVHAKTRDTDTDTESEATA
jgi:hypothetical protein